MSETKWTPGPWRVAGERYDTAIEPDVVMLGDNGACGDPECCGEASYHIEIREADARLIAAAPDLYEALAGMLRAFGGVGETTSPACAAALAALARARGETP